VEFLEILFLTLLGLALGSFLNVTIDRLPRGESLIRPPSRCDACLHRLGPLDLVPLLSYLRLLGRCRYCGVRIPYRSPLVEAVTGAGCGFIAYQFGVSLATAVLVLYLTTVIHYTLAESEHSSIFDSTMSTTLVIVLLTLPFSPLQQDVGLRGTYLQSLAGAGAGVCFVSLISPMFKDHIDAKQMKLAILLGLMLGFQYMIAGLVVGSACVGITLASTWILNLTGRSFAVPVRSAILGGAFAVLISAPSFHSWLL
jgi:leader peptidase (prepilin peptidase)/N-methyltransferase